MIVIFITKTNRIFIEGIGFLSISFLCKHRLYEFLFVFAEIGVHYFCKMFESI